MPILATIYTYTIWPTRNTTSYEAECRYTIDSGIYKGAPMHLKHVFAHHRDSAATACAMDVETFDPDNTFLFARYDE
jgi:hypothetical protein